MALLQLALRVSCIFGAASVLALNPSERVENFRLLDHQGSSHELYYFADAPALVE